MPSGSVRVLPFLHLTYVENTGAAFGIGFSRNGFFIGLSTALRIEARSAVETAPRLDMPEALDQGEWDRLRSSFVLTECFEFLQPHGYAVETPALHAFVETRGLNDLRRRE